MTVAPNTAPVPTANPPKAAVAAAIDAAAPGRATALPAVLAPPDNVDASMRCTTAGPRVDLVSGGLRRLRSPLYAFVSRRVEGGLVEDVLQTAAVRALERAEALREPGRLDAWLFRIHRNVIADTVRRQGNERRMVNTASVLQRTLEQRAAAEPGCGCALGLAQGIKASYVSILRLIDLEDASIADAARELGISTNNATVRLHRARRALAVRLREHCGVSSVRECAGCPCALGMRSHL